MTYYDIHTGEEITDYELEVRFREMLSETLETVRIGTLEYDPARALEALDPIAYRCEFADYVSSELDETIVESGYWLRVLTVDGELEAGPVWFADEVEARDAFADQVADYSDIAPGDRDDVLTVQLYTTGDDVVAETRTGE